MYMDIYIYCIFGGVVLFWELTFLRVPINSDPQLVSY